MPASENRTSGDAEARGRTVELDGAPTRLPTDVLHELWAHARGAYPYECCGLILGGSRERYEQVMRCHNTAGKRHAENPEEFPRNAFTGFFIDPGELLHAFRTAEASDREITAVYHSHVGSRVYLSELDLQYVDAIPGADQIVVAVLGPEPARVAGTGVFAREGPDAAFVGHPVEEPGPV